MRPEIRRHKHVRQVPLRHDAGKSICAMRAAAISEVASVVSNTHPCGVTVTAKQCFVSSSAADGDGERIVLKTTTLSAAGRQARPPTIPGRESGCDEETGQNAGSRRDGDGRN